MTTATTPSPDIPLPAGAEWADTWEMWANEFRIFHAPDRVVLRDNGDKLLEVSHVGSSYLMAASIPARTRPASTSTRTTTTT